VNRVLVVDDEPAITDAVAYALATEGFEVDVSEDGEEALQTARAGAYDVILLDAMLPHLSGFEVCRRLRAESDVPILMLTARDGEVDRVLGLEIGADDYVTKPFSMPELLGRIRAILRRRELDAQSGRPSEYRVGAIRVDLVRHLVTVDGAQVRLTPSEYKILTLLAAEPGRVFSRREILQHLWDSSYVGDERACDVHLSNLRRKLERDPAAPERVVTVRGAGYALSEV
jgi:two-component system, OmpR family, response regulator RegX3